MDQAEPADADKPTVLVIEDNADQWFIIEWAFHERFPEVQPVWMADPAKAVMYLETCVQDSNPLPKLIVLDAYLPCFEQSQKTLTLLKSDPIYQDIPILVLTNSRHRQDMIACYERGCNSYIVKPTTITQWQALLTHLRHYWWEIAQLPNPL